MALVNAKIEVDDTIQDLDVKLNKVIARQEQEYMNSYSYFVKKKEAELKAVIDKFKEKSEQPEKKSFRSTIYSNHLLLFVVTRLSKKWQIMT